MVRDAATTVNFEKRCYVEQSNSKYLTRFPKKDLQMDREDAILAIATAGPVRAAHKMITYTRLYLKQ